MKLTPRERRLRDKYGITEAVYEWLLRGQNGVCRICLRPPKKMPLHVDHNHKTGEIRGLLCFRCNYGLGHFRSRQELLRAAEHIDRSMGILVPKKRRKRKRKGTKLESKPAAAAA